MKSGIKIPIQNQWNQEFLCIAGLCEVGLSLCKRDIPFLFESLELWVEEKRGTLHIQLGCAPILRHHYLLDKYSCLALQVLALLAAVSVQDFLLWCRNLWQTMGNTAVKLQHSPENKTQQNSLQLDKIPIQSA